MCTRGSAEPIPKKFARRLAFPNTVEFLVRLYGASANKTLLLEICYAIYKFRHFYSVRYVSGN